MPFDPTTAKPDAATPGTFDPGTATSAAPQTMIAGLQAGKLPGGPQALAAKAAERAAQVKAKTDVALGHDPDVDYASKLSFGDRTVMAKLDNDAERKMYLERKYGEGSVSTDKRGRLVVKRDDKKTAVGKPGVVPSLLGEATPMATGTTFAAAASEMGPVAQAIAFGLGAGAGKGIDQIIKSAYGLQSLTRAEQAKSILKETEMGMAGEGGGRLAGKAFNRATRGRLPKVISGQTPETDRLTELTTSRGATPPAFSALPDSKRIQWQQDLAHRIVGPNASQETANQKFIDDELKNILRSSGVPKGEIDAVFDAIVNPKAALSTREMGEDLKATVKARVDTLQSLANQEGAKLDQEIDRQFTHINNLMNRYKPGDLGVDVAGGIAGARKQFSTAMGKAYSRVDQLVGDEALVPTAKIKQQADQVLASLPKREVKGEPQVVGNMERTPTGYRLTESTETPVSEGAPVLGDARVIKALDDLKNIPDKISFSEAQKIRSSLGELGELKDLVPGVSKRQYMDLRNSVNVALKLAGSEPRAAEAKRLLDHADGLYSKGIKKFEDTTINKLVRDAETGILPDAGVIAETITRGGYTQRAETIKNLVGEKVWQRVAAADWQGMIGDATRAFPDRGDVIDGKVLRSLLKDRGSMLDTVYGPKQAQEIRTYADRLAAKDGKIPAQSLDPGNFKAMVEARDKSQRELDTFMKDNFLSALSDPKKMPDVALDWIVKPGQESRLMQAVQFFGDQSPQVAAIRQAALHDLLARATTTTETGVSRRVSPEGIEEALRKLTNRQQDMLFPNGLADDIRLLAQETKFLYPKLDEQMSAGLSAGSTKKMPLWRYAPAAAYSGFWSWMLGKPQVIRFLALGLQHDSPARDAAMNTIDAVARMTALGMKPDTEHKGGVSP